MAVLSSSNDVLCEPSVIRVERGTININITNKKGILNLGFDMVEFNGRGIKVFFSILGPGFLRTCVQIDD